MKHILKFLSSFFLAFSFLLIHAQTQQLVLPLGFSNSTNGIGASPDGNIIFNKDVNSRLWDVASGLLIIPDLAKHYDVRSAYLSPDVKTFFAVEKDYTTTLREVKSGRILYVFNLMCPAGSSVNVFFSPDAKLLLTSLDSKDFTIWNLITRKPKYKIKSTQGQINSIAFSNNCNLIATSDQYNYKAKTAIWNTNTGELVCEVKGLFTQNNNYCFSPDGSKVITVGKSFSENHQDSMSFGISDQFQVFDPTAYIWDTKTGKLIKEIREEKGVKEIKGAFFSPNGDSVVTISEEYIKFWTSAKGLMLQSFKILQGQYLTYPLCFTWESSKLFIGLSNEIKVFDMREKDFYGMKTNFHSINSFVLLKNKKIAIYGNSQDFNGGFVEVLDMKNGYIEKKISGHTLMLPQLYKTKDNILLYSLSEVNNSHITPVDYRIWDISHASLKATIRFTLVPPTKKFDFKDTIDCYERNGDFFVNKCIGANRPIFTKKILNPSNAFRDSVQDNISEITPPSGTLLDYCEGNGFINRIGRIKLYNKFGDKLIMGDNAMYNTKLLIFLGFKELKVFNSFNGNLINKLLINERFRSAAFDVSGKRVVTIMDKKATIWNIEKCIKIADITQHKSNICIFAFNPDGESFVTCSEDGVSKIWDIQNGQLMANLFYQGTNSKNDLNLNNNRIDSSFYYKVPITGADNARYSRDGTLLITNSYTGQRVNSLYQYNSVFWDSKKGVFLFIIPGYFCDISSDNRIVLTAKDGQLNVWNAATGKQLFTIAGEFNGGGIFSNDDKYILISKGEDGEVDVYNTKNGKFLYKFLIVDSTDYFSQIPSGYYTCSGRASKLLHYITKDLKIITFDQLDTKYNRPDKVLESIGSTDTALINAYRQAYYKRIEKLDIDTSSFNNDYNVPEADFENRDNIDIEQKKPDLQLKLTAKDKTTKLDRYNIWINEVPLYGQRGKSLRNTNTNELKSLSVNVQLTPGKNKIEFSVYNENGIESYRQPLYVNYIPTGNSQKERTYFVGIGINKFASNTNPLSWCVKDIRDLAMKMKEKMGSQFVILDTLFDQQVTLEKIKKLKAELLKTGINDKVIIAYSGHGLLSKKYDYYLSGYQVDFKNPETGGIPYEELEGLLDSIPARKKLLLLDACNSGEVDKKKDRNLGNNTNNGESGTVGKGPGETQVVGVEKNKLGLENSFDLMRELFVNVNKGTGATVIAAAQGYQSALEQNKLGHGVFTYSLLEALSRNSSMKVSELKKWISEQVVKLTEGKQQPTTRIEPIDADWIVW
jgi:WD40 repeat protein